MAYVDTSLHMNVHCGKKKKKKSIIEKFAKRDINDEELDEVHREEVAQIVMVKTTNMHLNGTGHHQIRLGDALCII